METYTGFSGRASLATLGLWMQAHTIWEPIAERVKIKQKVHKHTPTEKLKDLFINMRSMAGGHGMADINHRVRVDQALQLAFGCRACAEQSTISDTLNASTAANVRELAGAVPAVYQQQGPGYRQA